MIRGPSHFRRKLSYEPPYLGAPYEFPPTLGRICAGFFAFTVIKANREASL